MRQHIYLSKKRREMKLILYILIVISIAGAAPVADLSERLAAIADQEKTTAATGNDFHFL